MINIEAYVTLHVVLRGISLIVGMHVAAVSRGLREYFVVEI